MFEVRHAQRLNKFCDKSLPTTQDGETRNIKTKAVRRDGRANRYRKKRRPFKFVVVDLVHL